MPDPKPDRRLLDDVHPYDRWSRPDGWEDEAVGRTAPPGRAATGRRLAAVGVAVIASASVGLSFTAGSDRSGDTAPDRAPADELRITCTDEGARVEHSVVALQAHGMQVAVANRTGARLIYMRDPARLEGSVAIELLEPTTRHAIPLMEVGTWITGCFGTSGSFNARTVPLSDYSEPFEVVDPGRFMEELREGAPTHPRG